jgi:ribose transport system ATP-binding protein
MSTPNLSSVSPVSSAADAPVLSVEGIGKTYAEPVLGDITLDLRAGEVLALTGENGAGKSTLSKIIGGLVTPTTGSMKLGGAAYAPASRKVAEALGVRMVMQELNLLPTLSVAENLFLNRLPKLGPFGVIDRSKLREDARHAMAQVGLDAIDPDTLVGSLGIGHQQMVEIARNLIGDCRVLILDEPTAMLTAREVDLLFEQVARLKARGVALVYISHRLEELARISERVAVLRDGRLVHVDQMASVNTDRLVTLMVGRDIGERIDLGERRIGQVVFKVEHMTRKSVVRDVSFEVKAGEIFGISGLIGAGRTELMRLIYGADRGDSGVVSVAHGGPMKPVQITSPSDAVENGIALITEDRKGEGLLLTQPIATNISLGHLSAVSSNGIVDARREVELARKQIDAMHIRSSGPEQPVSELSGGNQQKVVIGRWLARDCTVLLFDEPTRGIDVGAKFDIYALMGALAREGRALVVVSSDLRELMSICDRIAVMSAGQLTGMFERGAWTQDALLAAAFAGYTKREEILHAPIEPDCKAPA